MLWIALLIEGVTKKRRSSRAAGVHGAPREGCMHVTMHRRRLCGLYFAKWERNKRRHTAQYSCTFRVQGA